MIYCFILVFFFSAKKNVYAGGVVKKKRRGEKRIDENEPERIFRLKNPSVDFAPPPFGLNAKVQTEPPRGNFFFCFESKEEVEQAR